MYELPNQSNIEKFAQEYEVHRPLQEQFTLRLVELLKNLLELAGADFHLIEQRTKSASSYKEKLTRASKSYSAPLKEITDLTGIRIILYYEDDLLKISDIIESEFWVDKRNSHEGHELSRPEEFGYQSRHYIIKLLQQRRVLAEWKNFSDLNAEIQIRTVLQHSWAAISHKLQYKRESDIPLPLRRRLFRLSALLELADQEFLSLKHETAELVESIEQKLSEGNQNISIDVFSVEEYLRSSTDVKTLVSEAREIGFRLDHFDNEMDFSGLENKTISDLVDLAKHLGLETIADLAQAMSRSLKNSKRFLADQLNDNELGGSKEWAISPTFACTLILIGLYKKKVTIKYLRGVHIKVRYINLFSSVRLRSENHHPR